MSVAEDFWRQDCYSRGPGLSHTHGEHVGNIREVHAECPCRDCDMTPLDWARRLDVTSREAGIVDPDSLPLALPQPNASQCMYQHESLVHSSLRSNAEGHGWLVCPGCQTPLEPKLAAGAPSGPPWGIGRGWVSPRMKSRWAAIAYRFAGRFG